VQEVLYEKEDGRKSICITLRLFHWLCSRLVGIRKIAGRMQVDSFAALYHMDGSQDSNVSMAKDTKS
jgi:hypothetical protein